MFLFRFDAIFPRRTTFRFFDHTSVARRRRTRKTKKKLKMASLIKALEHTATNTASGDDVEHLLTRSGFALVLGSTYRFGSGRRHRCGRGSNRFSSGSNLGTKKNSSSTLNTGTHEKKSESPDAEFQYDAVTGDKYEQFF